MANPIIPQLKITKFFPVKTPQGITQRNETLANYSIGCDLYMPPMSEEFLKALESSNNDLQCLRKFDEHSGEEKVIGYDNNTLSIVFEYFPNQKAYYIYRPLQIPTGIGMLIDDEYWIEVRSKSSNFKNGFTVVHGTIDMNYTYGCGVQLIPINLDYPSICITEDQKICQFVFHKAIPVMQIQEIPLENWENDPDVNKRRTVRTGGFGSTGKF